MQRWKKEMRKREMSENDINSLKEKKKGIAAARRPAFC